MTKSSKNFRRNGASQYTINIVDNAIGYISCHEWLQNVSPKLMTSLQYRIWNIEKWRNGVVLQLKDLFLLVFEVNLPFKVKFGCKRFALQINEEGNEKFLRNGISGWKNKLFQRYIWICIFYIKNFFTFTN